MNDPYSVLGITPSATEEEIKKAYRSKCKEFHPDLHPGDAAAEDKFKEVQAAYSEIMKIKQNGGSYTGGYAGGGSGYGGQQYYGSGYGSAQQNDPFGFGFDPFEAFFGGSYGYSRAGYGSGAQAPDQDTRMQAARNYINARHYTEAMHVLESIPISERRARWYYYAALASSGLGNRVNALEYAKKAVELEPGNYEYQNLLDRLQNYSRNYRNMNSGYTTQSFGVWRICLPWLLLSFFCRCFPCFCYF